MGLELVQIPDVLLRARQLAAELGDPRLGLSEARLVLLARAALGLGAALELLEEILADRVEPIALGAGSVQLLAQLGDAALGSP